MLLVQLVEALLELLVDLIARQMLFLDVPPGLPGGDRSSAGCRVHCCSAVALCDPEPYLHSGYQLADGSNSNLKQTEVNNRLQNFNGIKHRRWGCLKAMPTVLSDISETFKRGHYLLCVVDWGFPEKAENGIVFKKQQHLIVFNA